MKVVILGGGFAGVRCAQDLSKDNDFEVTLIDRKDYFELSFAQIAALVDPLTIGEKSRYLYSSFLKAPFIQAEVTTVEEDMVLLSDGRRINYEILVVATGSSYRSFPIGKPIAETKLSDRNAFFVSENSHLISAKEILIIGGGPVGVELAGEIASRYSDKKIFLAHGNDRLLNFLRPSSGKKALRILSKLGVDVVLNDRLVPDGIGRYRSIKSSKVYMTDLAFNCIGTMNNTAFMREHFSNSMDERNLLMVGAEFLVRNTKNIYAIGDCAAIDEAKLAIFANSHGEFLSKHLIALSKKRKVTFYALRKTIAIVPIGRKEGVVEIPFGKLIKKLLIEYKTKDFFIDKYRKSHGVVPTGSAPGT
jgi:NADH dehydrogenase FAD-containing subunit